MMRAEWLKFRYRYDDPNTESESLTMIPEHPNSKICGNHSHRGAGFEFEIIGLHVQIQKENSHQYRQQRDYQEYGVQIGPWFAEFSAGIITRFWRRHGHLSELRFAGNWG
jgi:hypothetical protein